MPVGELNISAMCMPAMLGISLCLLVVLEPLLVSSELVQIGVVSGPDDDPRQNIDKFWEMAQNVTSPVKLEPVPRVTPWWGVLQVIRAVCDLSKLGASGLVALGPNRLNNLLASYSNFMGLPLVTTLGSPGKYQVSILPDTSQAAADLISYYEWQRFAFIYDSDNGADQLQKVLRLMDSVPQVEAFWKVGDAEQAFRFIVQLPPSARRVLMATSERTADELAAKMAGTRLSFHFMLLRPVGMILKSGKAGNYRLTKFSILGPEQILRQLENRWRTLMPYSMPRTATKDLPDKVILTHDVSSIFYTLFTQIYRERPDIFKSRTGIDCLNFDGKVPETANLINKVVIEQGATGKISFDESGQRADYLINIFETTPADVKKIGVWADTSGLHISPEFSKETTIPKVAAFRDNPPIKVTSIMNDPFLKIKPDGTQEGFIVDFVEELFNVIGRSYQIRLVQDNAYGIVRNGEYNGMIGELLRGEADIAVADLTKTPERAKVVDFSKSFMTFGLNILMKKEEADMDRPHFGPFAFLSVWSVEVWLLVLLFVAIFSATCYAISRFTGVPDRIRALESKGTDNLSPCGSVWFTAGALLFRDTGIYPRTFSHRVWALLWWAFCLFLLLMYISSLSSALIKTRKTVTTIYSRKTSHEVMKEVLETGYPKLGVLKSGSTRRFFQNSEVGMYKEFSRYIEQNPDVSADSYRQAVQRIRSSDGSYAFIMESSSSALVADTQPCDTYVSAGFLDTKVFAVAMKKDSPLREVVDDAVLALMERGTIRRLYEKWWHNTSSSCEDPMLDILPKVYSSSMTLHEVSGVFYMLILFALISIGVAVAEYYVRSKNITIE